MSTSQERKNKPAFSGVLMYFPDAIMAIAEHSKKGNDKHNPGQPMHWAKEKSTDHADCIARHLIDISTNWDATDPETGSLHATALAWRALALLQTVLERQIKGQQLPTIEQVKSFVPHARCSEGHDAEPFERENDFIAP